MRSVKNKHNRCLAAVLALCLLLGLYPLTPSAQAEETTATVAGSTTRENAQSVPVGVPVTSTLSAGRNYYAIPDVKAGQQISLELDKAYSGTSLGFYRPNGQYLGGGGNGYQLSRMANSDGTYYFSIEISQPKTVSFTVTLYDNDAHEPNDTLETATPIEPGVPVEAVLLSGEVDFFAFTTTKPYQYVVIDEQHTGASVNVGLYDAAGAELESGTPNGKSLIFCAGEAGMHYLKFYAYNYGHASYSFTVTLYDNDANEPNDTKETAAALHDGESTEFTLAGCDADYFKVITTKPGQDIALTVSGYNYANRGERFSLYLDPAGDLRGSSTSCAAYAEIDANKTLYLHAGEAGEHDIALKRWVNVDDPLCLTRTLSVEILDGDENERNDTRETATPLTVGTDAAFMVGGFGDEDWFSFEAVPGAMGKALYTLSFLDLNTDYSDEFFYEVYAPDGTPVVERTRVNIRHVNTIGCDRQGQYLVRVYTTAAKGTNYFAPVDGSGRAMDYKRSALRICVSEGGDDPYESNDTWLTAANVPVGKLQHVLATAADEDWFCFTVPENDMTLHLTSTKRTNAALYRAGDLMEQGDRADSLFYGNRDTYYYYKLMDAGVYYLKLTAGSSYISPEIRTTGIELLPATDEENNDTWKKATPLYEGVLRSFEISAGNDVDWFKLVVPKGGARVDIQTSHYLDYSLYREKDFIAAGDNAAAMHQWKDTVSTVDLDAGTYYLKATAGGRNENCSIIYNILPANTNVSLETAKLLAPGEWAEYYENVKQYGSEKYCYFCIGERKAGEVVRISRDAVGSSGSLYLLNAAGESIGQNYEGRYCTNYTFRIPADGSYYLKTKVYRARDNNGRLIPNRLRYDIGSGEEKVSAIESADSLTLLEGEEMFFDLRCAPYGAMSRAGKTFYCNPRTHADWDEESGYLRAKSAGTGTLTVGTYNGGDSSSVKKEIPVTVLAKDDLKALGVSIANAPESLSLGASADLTANYTLAGGVELTNPQKAVTWTSSDPKVLYVAPGGMVVAVGSGTATVTASVGGVSEESAPITVTAAPETPQETVSSIKLSEYSLKLYVGEPGKQLTATVLPEGSAASVKWSSSNREVATVSEKGLVTPVGPGMSIISAEAGGRRVSATVAVLAQRVRVSGVSFEKTSYELPLGGQRLVLEAEVTPGNATDKTLIWTSSNEGVATVSRTGIVTALSVGETTIRATSVDGGYFAEVTVTVTAKAQLGDVNGDGYIDAGDAMLCMRYSVGLEELKDAQKAAADVNRDGFIDAGDAILILRYDAKLIDRLN